MEDSLDKKIRQTQEYTVLVTDEQQSASGSGLLYYLGGETFFVFTCRHTIANIASDTLQLYLLLAVDMQADKYREHMVRVPKSQVVFPPKDEEDFAVIQVQKDEDLPLPKSRYFINEATRNLAVYVHGYPGGRAEGEDLLEALDVARGTVLCSISDKHRFSLRCEEPYLDQGDRRYELEGYSGSPVWKEKDEMLSTIGLLSAGARDNVYRARVYAEKMEYVRSFMKNRFGIFMETKLEGIPEADVAGTRHGGGRFGGTADAQADTENDAWLEKRVELTRGYIDDLQYQKAIDTAKSGMGDENFARSSKKKQRHLMELLLYCYEIIQMDDEYRQLERQMDGMGMIDGHNYLRAMTSTFGRKDFVKTISYAEEYLQKPVRDDDLSQVAEAFLLLSRAHTDDFPYEDTIGRLVDEKDDLVWEISDPETESLIYQMIGYVLSEHYHRHVQAIRCLNKSYRQGADKMVLETLAAAYYFFAIANATDKDDRVRIMCIDKNALYKARECFILIMDKADDLFWGSAIKRMGLVIYNTFVFSRDNYRSIRVYSDIRKFLPELPEKELRDVEIKYARIDCQKGDIDFSQYQTFTEQDKQLFSVLADLYAASQFLASNPAEVLQTQPVANQLMATIRHAEDALESVDEGEKLKIRVDLVNLYGRGIFLYGWDCIGEIQRHFEEIRKSDEPELIESLQNFIFECGHPFEEAAAIYRKRFEENRTLNNWHELLNLYIRHFKLDEADALYEELFLAHSDLIGYESEFIYRAYIDYITVNRRDPTKALRCYLQAKDHIKDPDIANFWELELMLVTSTFNDPDRFERERLPYLKRGLISPETYHHDAFVAYMLNLNQQKTREHNFFPKLELKGNRYSAMAMPNELLCFLAWQGEIKPLRVLANNKYMLPQNKAWAMRVMREEDWHQDVSAVAERYNLAIDRTIAIDAWALCLLAFDGKLMLLGKFDAVYVSHLTVARLMEEAKRTALDQVHQVLEYIEKNENMYICSANFSHQIDVREKIGYNDIASAVAIAYEKECPLVVGDPEIKQDVIKHYAQMLIRANDFECAVALAFASG